MCRSRISIEGFRLADSSAVDRRRSYEFWAPWMSCMGGQSLKVVGKGCPVGDSGAERLRSAEEVPVGG